VDEEDLVAHPQTASHLALLVSLGAVPAGKEEVHEDEDDQSPPPDELLTPDGLGQPRFHSGAILSRTKGGHLWRCGSGQNGQDK
jgi:hypothetical protein